jgi:hypothetical protein
LILNDYSELPSKEKKRLDGFLAGKERLREKITKESSMPKQKKLL